MTIRQCIVLNTDQRRTETLGPADTLENVRAVDGSATAITTTGLADLAGCTFALDANRTYVFDFSVTVTQTGLLATVGFGVAYTGTSSSTFAQINVGGVNGSVLGLLQVVTNTIALGATIPSRVTGRIRTTSAGVLSLQGQRSAGTCTVNGSFGTLQRV